MGNPIWLIPAPFFPGRIIPLFPSPVLVLAWLYRNKAKLDKGSIPFEAGKPYQARNISPDETYLPTM